jgi:hypothetical protein
LARIGSANEFTFHADVTFDHVLPSGQKLQYSATEEVVMKRAGGLYVEWNGDLGARQFWYDGKSVTLYNPAVPFYAGDTAPPELDNMLAQLLPKLDFTPPLADLLYRDPYKTVRGNIQYGFDLGQTDVGGRSCRTLAFVEKDIDLADLDRKWAAADPVQARDHLQKPASTAAIHGGVQRLELRAAHRSSGVHAGIAAGYGKNSIRDRRGCQVAREELDDQAINERKEIGGCAAGGRSDRRVPHGRD